MTYLGATEWLVEVAKGKVAGHSVIQKFGENPDIDTGGVETIWDGGGTYVPPTQARIHDIASTDANDAGTVVSSGTATGGSLTSLVDSGATFVSDGVAVADVILNDTSVEIGIVTGVTSETELAMGGIIRSPQDGVLGTAVQSGDSYRVVTNASTGAGILFVQGLDASFLEVNEFVVLNGTSNVATVGSYIRQYRARVFGANVGAALGIVTSTAQTDGTVSAQVIASNNQTLMAVYSIPFGKTGFLLNWWATLSKKQAATSSQLLRAGTLDGFGYAVSGPRALSTTANSGFDHDFKIPIRLGPGVDIWIEGDTDANNIGISAGFDILLVDD